MSWAADWQIPQPRVDDTALQAALAAACARAGYRLVQLAAAGEDGATAVIAIGDQTGSLAIAFRVPTVRLEDKLDSSELTGMLRVGTEELDDDGLIVDDGLIPMVFYGLADARLGGVTVLGHGRAILGIDRDRRTATVQRVMARDDVEDAMSSGAAGLYGIARRHGTWIYGGPALLYRDGIRIPTGLEDAAEDVLVAGLVPVAPDRALAVVDDGSAYWLGDGTATPIPQIARTRNYAGFWETPWSIAERGDELWLANGSDHIYCIRGETITAIPRPRIDSLAVASDGRIWLLERDTMLHVGDGEHFELVHRDVRLSSLAAGRAGSVVAFVPGEAHLPREESPARMLVFAASGNRDFELGTEVTRFGRALCSEGDLAWVVVGDGVLAVEPAGAFTKLSLDASRADNQALWVPMTELAARVAAALGGWEITRARTS